MSGKLEVKIILLNNFVKTSEQLSLLAFKTFGLIFLIVLAFLELRLLNSFSISDAEKASSSDIVISFFN